MKSVTNNFSLIIIIISQRFTKCIDYNLSSISNNYSRSRIEDHISNGSPAADSSCIYWSLNRDRRWLSRARQRMQAPHGRLTRTLPPVPFGGAHGETNAAIPRFLRGLNARRCRDKPVENHGRSGTGDRLRR